MDARTTRTRERQEFRARHPFRRGCPSQYYPKTLLALPGFATWPGAEVDRPIAEGCDVFDMVKESARLPSAVATAYKSMKVHGIHLRVCSVEYDKNTSDSSVAATFLQPRRGTENEVEPILIPVEYIGWIEEILELDNGGHCIIVLLYS
jgi:hypothetical protein